MKKRKAKTASASVKGLTRYEYHDRNGYLICGWYARARGVPKGESKVIEKRRFFSDSKWYGKKNARKEALAWLEVQWKAFKTSPHVRRRIHFRLGKRPGVSIQGNFVKASLTVNGQRHQERFSIPKLGHNRATSLAEKQRRRWEKQYLGA